MLARILTCMKVVGMMGHQDIAAKCQHINFGLVLGMSTRKGKSDPNTFKSSSH